MSVLQPDVQDYITFILRTEFGLPLFNGYFAQVNFDLGQGFYIESEANLNSLMTKNSIPNEGIPDLS